MKTRVITAIVMVAVMVPFFIFSDTPAFPVLIALLSLIGVYEMQGCIGAKGSLPSLIPTAIFAAVMPFLARYLREDILSIVFLLSFSLIVLSFIVSLFSGEKFKVESAALSCATGIYISFGFSSIVLLRDMNYGVYVFLLAFLIPWVTDTFAYFSGYLFGKHKLIPTVSPKKTVEGSVGGTAFAILFTLLYGFIVGNISNATPNYLGLGIVALAVSILSQCGDLIMSLIKRKFGIKDYGKLFPGHGGVLDRFDSIICTAPFIFFLGEYVTVLSLFR